jgi:hypothetical protein
MSYIAGMDLPPDRQLRWILRKTAALLELGAEPVRGLVLPTAEFFPDRFDGSPESVGTVLARVQEHAGLSDVPVELTIVLPDGDTISSSCSSGACGGGAIAPRSDRVGQREDGTYTVAVGAGEIRHPTALTTALVRSVSTMFLAEAGAFDDLERAEREPATDLAGVLLGFGVLVANGSYIYTKACSGVAVQSATHMPVGEVTVALAIFCKMHDAPERLVSKHLDPTPRDHFDEALVWAHSNASLVRLLRGDPRSFEDDTFSLAPARSWLGRMLGGKRKPSVKASDDDLAELERSLAASASKKSVDPEKARRLAELRALVDESLEP